MTLTEIKEKQTQLINRCQEIVDTCKGEVREMTEDEKKEFDSIKEELEQLKEEVKSLEDSENKDENKEEEEENKKEDEQPEGEQPENENKEDEGKNKSDSDEEADPEKEDKNNRNITMEQKFNLMKELRNSLETGKSFNLNEVRAYTVNAEGEDVVQTDIFDIWGPLRAKNVLVAAGAQYISGIKNNVQIPLMGKVSCSFEGETDAANDGSGAFTKKTLSPKRITAKYPISLQLLAQDSVGVEAKIREDIIAAVNAKLEEVLLGTGVGSATIPAGLFNGVTPTQITDFKGITSLEATVETNNVYGDMKYIVSPAAKGDLRAMAKSTKSTQLVMENGTIDGTEVLATSHVSGKNLIYGDFSNVVIAAWDNVQIDVVRDVQSVGNGQVTIVVNAFVDGALIRPEGLAFGTTATA